MFKDGKEIRFRGVRKRKWGKYVAEIRSGKRSRISLGSYFTAEAAARAYDAALLCLRGPNETSFNFPDSKFKRSPIFVAEAHSNLSAQLIRAIAIDVGSACDTVYTKTIDHNVQTEHSGEEEPSIYVAQGVNDLDISGAVEGEEDMCETKYLLQSPGEISLEERVQMSLLLPEEEEEEKEMMQPYDPSEIFPDFGQLEFDLLLAQNSINPPRKDHSKQSLLFD